MQIKRKARILGETVTITINVPDNKTMNAYMAERLRVEKDEDLLAFRAQKFDEWVADIAGGLTKDQILDIHKSGIIFQVFESVDIEKN